MPTATILAVAAANNAAQNNASSGSAGPLIWQAVMMLLTVAWGIWIMTADPSDEAFKASLIGLVVTGITLIPVIIYLT